MTLASNAGTRLIRLHWGKLLLSASILAPFAVLALYPAQPPSGDRAEHLFSPLNQRHDLFEHISIGPLVPGTSLSQRFIAREDGLSRITMRFGTFGGVTGCSIIATVRDPDGTLVRREERGCFAIPDTTLVDVATFKPQRGSSGKTYSVEIAMTSGSRDAIHAWAALPESSLPPASLGTVAWPVAAELHTGYGKRGSALSQLLLASNRAGQYRPFWGRQPMFIALLLGLVALALLLVWAPPRWRVALLLAIVSVKGLLWSVILPPLEGPDEEAHYAYAQYMAEEGKVPDRGGTVSAAGVYSEELAKGLRTLNVHRVPTGDRPDFSKEDEGVDEDSFSEKWSRESPGNGPAAGYPPAYYGPSALLYLASEGSILPVKVGVMRLWSVLLGTLAVWVTVRIGRRIFSGSVLPILLGLCVGLQPMFSQQAAVLNNDILVVFGSFLCIDALVRLIRPPVHPRLPFDAGLSLGVATLGKPYGIAMAPVLALGWLIGWLRDGSRSASVWLRSGALASAGFALTFGAWWAASKIWGLSGIPFPTNASAGPKTLPAYVDQIMSNGGSWLAITWVDRFWGDFSWLDTHLPEALYSKLRWGTVVGVILIGVWAVLWVLDRFRNPATRYFRDTEGAVTVWAFLITIVSMLLLLHAIEFFYFHKVGRVELLQGRYALGVLPALLALPALMAGRVGRGRPQAAIMWTLTVGMVALQILSAAVVVDRFYL